MKSILPLLADFANGIFAIFIASYATNTEILWWYIPIGMLLAMSPDLDAIPEILKRGKVTSSSEHTHDHRDGLHYPILFFLAGIVFVYLLGFWGWVFLLATILHFVNDFYGTGWGIKLCWPFSNRQYKLLGRRVNRLKYMLLEDSDWETLTHDERRLRIIVSWSRPELTQYIPKWGTEEWISKIYLHVNWISVMEYLLFVTSCVLVLSYFI